MTVIFILLTILTSLILRSLFSSLTPAGTDPFSALVSDRLAYFLIYSVLSALLFLKLYPLLIPAHLLKKEISLTAVFRGFSEKKLPVFYGLGAGILFLLMLLLFTSLSTNEIPETQRSAYVNLMKSDSRFLIFAGFLIVFVTPILEEFHYRFLLNWFLLRSSVPAALAILTQGLLFGLAHPPAAAAFLSLLGILLGFLSWYKGVTASVTAHSFYNASVLILSLMK